MNAWPYPRLIAHRGAGHLAPENTLASIEEGARRGYRCAEVDVACTADGVVVLMHDDSLARTTGGEGLVGEVPWAQLAGLDAGAWLHPRFAGTRIPTLAQVLVRCQELDLQLAIELKVRRSQDPRRLCAAVVKTVTEHRAGRQHLLISFNDETLRTASVIAPDIPRALLIGRELPADWAARLAACDASALDLDHRLITRELVATVHAAGYALIAWTVNDPARAAELLDWGVDGVTTDAVDLISPERAAQP